MATLHTLEQRNSLVRLELEPLDEGAEAFRRIYAFPKIIDWIQGSLPNLESSIAELDENPAQQLDNLLHDFISGGPLPYNRRFKPWVKQGTGVWYLKTQDLRLFGWFPLVDTFII